MSPPDGPDREARTDPATEAASTPAPDPEATTRAANAVSDSEATTRAADAVSDSEATTRAADAVSDSETPTHTADAVSGSAVPATDPAAIDTTAPTPPPMPCPRCGTPLAPEQEWCLQCGTAARTTIAATPRWRLPIAILAVVAVLCGAALAWAFVELTNNDDAVQAVTATPTTVTTAPAPAPAPGG